MTRFCQISTRSGHKIWSLIQDAGEYKCEAKNRQGTTASEVGVLNVIGESIQTSLSQVMAEFKSLESSFRQKTVYSKLESFSKFVSSNM